MIRLGSRHIVLDFLLSVFVNFFNFVLMDADWLIIFTILHSIPDGFDSSVNH